MSKQKDTYLIRVDEADAVPMTLEEANAYDAIKLNDGKYHLIHENNSYLVELVDIDWAAKLINVKVGPQIHQVSIMNPLDQLIEKLGLNISDEGIATDVLAPMPGLVLDIMVSAGDTVEKDQPLIILEAMKMENVIKATGEAVVKEVLVDKQQKLEKGQAIITFE